MTDKKLVHVVDDEEGVRRSLDFLLRTTGYNVQCWIDGDTFLKDVDGSVPACVLMDIRMPGSSGLEIQEQMPEHGLDFPVIVLSGHGDIHSAVRAMKAGAVDFVEKPFSRDKLLDAIANAFQRVENGEAAREKAVSAQALVARLTSREQEVLEGLACGYPNKTIAYDLGISPRTVEVYRANIMTKLKVPSFADALRIAFTAGLGMETQWRKEHSAQRLG